MLRAMRTSPDCVSFKDHIYGYSTLRGEQHVTLTAQRVMGNVVLNCHHVKRSGEVQEIHFPSCLARSQFPLLLLSVALVLQATFTTGDIL